MKTLGLFAAAIAFFAIGITMVLYEVSRIRADRPILKGQDAAKLYWIVYLSMFVLSATTGLKAIVGAF